MAQERCLILVDGSNFFFKLKSLQLHNLLSFDFTAFSHFLCRDGSLVSATYFVGKVKTDGTVKSLSFSLLFNGGVSSKIGLRHNWRSLKPTRSKSSRCFSPMPLPRMAIHCMSRSPVTHNYY